MSELSKYTPGQFSWVDLMAPDRDASKQFYGELFGWEAVDEPTDQGTVYTEFRIREKKIAGMGQMSDEMKAAGAPPVWSSYVSVDNADATAARVGELGGQVVMPVMQVMTVGRMAIFTDPEGAAFSIWEPGDHIGAEIVNEPGALCWNELATRDVTAAKTFYQALFGWECVTEDEGPSPYTEISLAGRANGGMLAIDASFPAEMPASWSPYFAVANCPETAERIQSLGGQVVAGPVEIPAGVFAACVDPQGAHFSVIALSQAD